MAKSAESSIQGLNIIPTDSLSDELSPMSDDLNREFAMWTNFPYSTSTIPQSDPNNSPAFSLERDTASRSRHKALEDFSSSAFFGSVGAAALAAAGPSEAAHERAKLQQLQHHMAHSHLHPDKPYHPPTAATSTAAMNDLFSSFMPYSVDGPVDPFVDPFLTPTDYANTPASGNGNGGGGLPPLTVRHPRNGDGRPVQGQQVQQGHSMQTIDPATTTISNRPTVPLPTKRAKPKPPAPLVIPVDREYAHHAHTAPASAFEDEDMDMQDDHHDVPLTDANGMPLSAAEDKRRRNTLASARFRQKKKEREAAMERKARELDDRVSGLERECESLRKENKMLRGLLVDGVPAAAANIEMDGLSVAQETNGNAAAAANASGASVVLLEELVRLLKANSAVLTAPNGQAPPLASTSKSTTTGKRKRGGA